MATRKPVLPVPVKPMSPCTAAGQSRDFCIERTADKLKLDYVFGRQRWDVFINCRTEHLHRTRSNLRGSLQNEAVARTKHKTGRAAAAEFRRCSLDCAVLHYGFIPFEALRRSDATKNVPRGNFVGCNSGKEHSP